MSTGQLAGKTAIITGAASGIGRATALRFAAEGAALVLGDMSADVHGVVQSISKAGGQAIGVTGDAGDEAHVAALVEKATERYGSIDVAFANAGISGGLPGIFDCDVTLWSDVLRTNLIGPWLIVKHAGQAMVAADRGGSIILTASVAGLRSGAGCPPYSASKAGVINLAQTSAQQLCNTGIRVNAICPGLTETGMTKPAFDFARDKDVMHKVGALNPLRRAGQPEELANVALFLASDQSSYINGQAIVVDGGLSSSHPVTRQLTGKTAA